MDKNFLIAIVLTTIIILIFTSSEYHRRFGKEIPPKPSVESTETPLSIDKKDITSLSDENSPQTLEQKGVDSSLQAESLAEVIQINPSVSENDFALENEDIRILFSTRGGIIKSATMKKFNGIDKNELAQLVKEGETWYNGKILDGESEINFSNIIFSEETKTDNNIELKAEITGNRTIIKKFSLDEQGFILHANTELNGNWENPVLFFSWHGPINVTEKKIKMIRIWPLSMLMRDTSTMYNKIVYLGQGDRTTINGSGKEKKERIYSDESSQKIDAGKIKNGGQDFFAGDLNWYAVRNKYFMSAAIPKEKMRWKVSSLCSLSGIEKWYDFSLSKQVSDGSTELDIYIGPISYDTLKSYNKNLTEIMELSWRFIRPLSIAFLWLLKKLHTLIPNWGLVIIAFSIIIKFVLYPLSHKSFVSMRKMSALQPQINELREKHKNNPTKLQQATMALYKKEGVNPFGGCLPMLFQMPVFFALYPVVGRSFELRQALFFPGWIEDLSRPDPFYILPVAMGISMFLQMKLTTKDPNQKAMLYVMPVVMVFLFANFSSGLTLYWFLFNVMSFMQQKIHIHK